MFGFYLGIEGEINFSLFGTLAGVVSSIFVSLNSIFTAKVLPLVNEDKSLLLYYNNVNAMILFIPLIIIFEKEVRKLLPSSPHLPALLISIPFSRRLFSRILKSFSLDSFGSS
jgi:drug/metabolite transporter (DMT)-like permease